MNNKKKKQGIKVWVSRLLLMTVLPALPFLCACLSVSVQDSSQPVIFLWDKDEEEIGVNEGIGGIGEVQGEMEDPIPIPEYTFRKEKYLTEHFEKHGAEFPYDTKEEYLAGANRVIASPDALTKTEAEDGDYVFYMEESNEFVILSTDGYIRTYFKPSGGKAYYDRQ